MNFEKQLSEHISVAEASRSLFSEVEATGLVMAQCLRAAGKLLTCGNGGSATDAMHLAEELTGRYNQDRPALAALCLNADSSALTCIGNDFGFEAIFARQVQALGKEGDILIGFTTSGNSANIIKAFKVAREQGVITVLVSGKGGGVAASTCDHEIIVPSKNTARIQEIHTFILHQWLEIIENQLFGF